MSVSNSEQINLVDTDSGNHGKDNYGGISQEEKVTESPSDMAASQDQLVPEDEASSEDPEEMGWCSVC